MVPITTSLNKDARLVNAFWVSVEYTDYRRGAELRLEGYLNHLASAMKRLENQ